MNSLDVAEATGAGEPLQNTRSQTHINKAAAALAPTNEKGKKVLVETQTNKKVRKLVTDNGLEFCSKEFNQFCRKQGIKRHKIVRGTPHQNGLAKRMN